MYFVPLVRDVICQSLTSWSFQTSLALGEASIRVMGTLILDIKALFGL